jgi:uncharacterized membrane protein (Fun14 family)
LSLANIPSTLFTAGYGGIIGFIVGFDLKKVMKILAIIAGVFLGALIHLQSQSIIGINWDKLQFLLEHSFLFVSNSASSSSLVSNVLGNIGLPLTGGLSAGLLLGFTKG